LSEAFVTLNERLPDDGAFKKFRVPTSLEEVAPLKQQDLSRALDGAAHATYFESLSMADRADILSETFRGASDFLEAAPSKVLGLALEAGEFLVELRRRLLLDVYEEDSYCPLCDGVLDKRGGHPGLCAGGGDRTLRHNAARNCTGRFAAAAGLGPVLEKPGLLQPSPDDPSQTSRRRPADVYLPTWSSGAPAALDFAITSPQRQDVLEGASREAGAAATAYEATKRQYLDTAEDCRRQGVTFVPMVAEPSGGWSPAAVVVFKRIARAASARTGCLPDAKVNEYFQQLSVAIRQANARATLRRNTGGLDEGVVPNPVASAWAALAQ